MSENKGLTAPIISQSSRIEADALQILGIVKSLAVAISGLRNPNDQANWKDLFTKLDALSQTFSGLFNIGTTTLQALETFSADAIGRLDQIEQDVNTAPPPDPGPTSLRFQIPTLLTKQGTPVMPATITFSDDHDFRVGFTWADDVGSVHAPPAADTKLVSSDPTVATADVAPDNMSMVVRSVADGHCIITGTNGTMTDTCDVTVALPTPTVFGMDATVGGPVAKGAAA